MKLSSFILALYLLALMAIPCIDVQRHESMNQIEFSRQSQNTHHHSDADNCSPFCTCNCCATSVIFQEFPVQLTCFSFSTKQHFHFRSENFSGPPASIWQPPKIA
ncbi:MAG: DUF6660 family protein [Bacteroidales bacterium]